MLKQILSFRKQSGICLQTQRARRCRHSQAYLCVPNTMVVDFVVMKKDVRQVTEMNSQQDRQTKSTIHLVGRKVESVGIVLVLSNELEDGILQGHLLRTLTRERVVASTTGWLRLAFAPAPPMQPGFLVRTLPAMSRPLQQTRTLTTTPPILRCCD